MATIRATASTASVDVLSTVSAAATTVTKTISSVGRVADAGYAWTDAWADNVEKNANAFKAVAGRLAQDKAIAWLDQGQQEIAASLKTNEDIVRFNALKKEVFG